MEQFQQKRLIFRFERFAAEYGDAVILWFRQFVHDVVVHVGGDWVSEAEVPCLWLEASFAVDATAGQEHG